MHARPTERQLRILKANRVAAAGLTREQATETISRIIDRKLRGLASLNQVHFLARFDIDADPLHYRTAQALLDELHGNGFRSLPAEKVREIIDRHEHPEVH